MILELISAPKDTLSEVELPNVKLPLIVASPTNVKLVALILPDALILPCTVSASPGTVVEKFPPISKFFRIQFHYWN